MVGHKRKRSKRKTRPTSYGHQNQLWPDVVVDELLSYLNSQVALLDPATETDREREWKDIEEDIVRHLNQPRAYGLESQGQCYNYSAKQIATKLAKLYAQRKRIDNGDVDWKILYQKGFACLDWTDDSERQVRMARRSKEIRHSWRCEFLKSPRRTRASSRLNDSPQNSAQRHIRASSSTLNVRGTSAEKSGTPGHHPLRTEFAVRSDQHVSDTESSATEDDENALIKTDDSTKTSCILLIPEHGEVQKVGLCLPDSQESSQEVIDGFDAHWKSSPGTAAHHQTLEASPAIVELKECLCATEKELRKAKREAKRARRDIDFWKERCRTAQQEQSRERNSKAALAAKLNRALSPSLSKIDVDGLLEREALLDRLITERNSRERIHNLMLHEDEDTDGETVSNVSRIMRNMGGRLGEIFEDAEFSSLAELEALPKDHLLRPLIEHAFGVEWDSADATQLLQRWHRNLSMRKYVLLSLCGAALTFWVFQQSQVDTLIDRFEGAATRSSTNRYRDAIRLVAQTDPALARSVDRMVHKKLAEEQSFKRSQRAKGRHLAHNLQEALAPLCELEPCTEEQSDAESELDGGTTSQLSQAFISAIDVHCRLALTGRRYECVWHKPGARFNEESMQLHGEREMSAAKTPTISLTLMPGINLVTASRISVDFGGFGERAMEEHEEAVCLVPALVLCRNIDRH